MGVIPECKQKLKCFKMKGIFRIQSAKDVRMIMTDSCGENIKIICIIWEGALDGQYAPYWVNLDPRELFD